MNATTQLPRETDILIVGGGIWGLSTAYLLAKSQKAGRVTLLERNTELADETTKQAAGQIGQLRSHPVMARAVGYTLDLLTNFHRETGYDPGLRTPGSIHVALCEERMDAFRRQEKAGVDLGLLIEVLEPETIKRWVPDIDLTNIVGAIYVEGDGYVDARQTALAYASAARDLGAELLTDAPVTNITQNLDDTWDVDSGDHTFRAQHVVITAGPWTALLAETVGITAPVCGIRLQQARTEVRQSLPEHHPVVRIPDVSCYLRPEKGGYLVGRFDPHPMILDPREKTPSFRTSEITPSEELVRETARLLQPVFPILSELAVDEYRQGIVTCAPDGWYVVGPAPKRFGLWLATGCAGMGIAGSGAVGKWLSDWIVHGDPGEDLSFLSPDRLHKLAAEWPELKTQCKDTFAKYYSLQGGATYSLGR